MIAKNFKERILTSFILLFLLLIMINSIFISTFILIVFSVLSLIEFFDLIKRIFNKKIYRYMGNIIFIIYLSLYSYLFFYFSNFLQLKIILYILILGCISSDVGGFAFGKIFKGPKLTKISPKKTYSGSIGSILLTCFVISVLVFLFTNLFSYSIIIISILTSIGCQLGDLFFSFLKRKANIKDTGKILPGHGGMLDRLDGILLGVPVGYLALILLIQ